MGTINFVLVGARNTGKTCYLAVLASHCPGVTTASDDTTAYLKVQRQLLDAGDLPQATASTMRELLFRYNGEHHHVEFSIDDYDGSFIESLSRHDTEDDISRSSLKARIQESEGLMFFMPYEIAPDEDALSNFEDEINTIISLVEEITQGKYKKLPIPAVICVTKWDRSPDYQQKNEIEAVNKYLDQNAYYHRARAKINRLFEHVLVQPVSAFGLTSDGIHPTKGKILPYQLEAPLNYCLDKTFQRYDEKIKDFQKNNDDLGLFDYLSELYDDFKHHKEGLYCQQFDELEKKYVENILKEIVGRKQLVLTEDQQAFFSCIRQESLQNKIQQALQLHELSGKKKKTFTWIAIIILIVGIAVYTPYYLQEQKEQQELLVLNPVITDQNLSSTELINKVTAFNEKWLNPMGLPLSSWFEKDRKAINHKVDAVIRERLQKLIKHAEIEVNINADLIKQLSDFSKSLDAWDDEDLRQTVQHEIRPFIDGYQLLDGLRKVLGKAESLTWNTYNEQKLLVANSAVHWKMMDSLLNQIHAAIAVRIKADAADALKSANKDDLERSAEELASLITDDGDAEAKTVLTNQVEPALEIAIRQEKFDAILSGLENEEAPSSIKQLIQNNWMPGFTEDQRKQLSELLQMKFNAYEDQHFPQIRELNSKDEMNGIRMNLNSLKDATTGSLVIGEEADKYEFRYLRSKDIDAKFKQWEKNLARYERALDRGIFGYITFHGNGSDDGRTDPLGFNCSMNDHDLEITIDHRITLPDDSGHQSPCSNNSLKWNIMEKLEKGQHSINVIEHDLTVSNDEWTGVFYLTAQNIFEFINHGATHVKAPPYDLLFSRK